MNPDAADASPKKTLLVKTVWGVLIAATLYVCYFSHLGAIGFVGPDEPRYAWIARDMVETGDWVTPRLYGKPWFEKPVLYYWGAALSFKLFGVSEAAARLPSAVCALLATLAIAWLAWRVYGTETARWLLVLLPTTVGMIGFSHAASTDMPFSGMLTIAMVCAAVVLGLTQTSNTLEDARSGHSEGAVRPRNLLLPAFFANSRFLALLGMTFTKRSQQASPESSLGPRTPWLALILFGFFLGLAVLAKGPAAIILSAGAVFFWALFTKRWKDAFRLLHPVAIAPFLVTALPWYILCACRNPDFFRIFIIEHNFKRFLTPEFQHIQPFWYYCPILLIAFLPWTALLLWAIVAGLAHTCRKREISSLSVFLLSWSLFCLVFFSISKSKLPGYILPAIPSVGLLLVLGQIKLVPVYRRPFRLTVLLASLVLAVFVALVALGIPHFSGGNLQFGIAIASILFLISLANFILGLAHGRSGSDVRGIVAACCVLPILSGLLQADLLVSDLFHWDPSGRAIARELQLRKVPGRQLTIAGMSRGQHFSLNFYMHDEIRVWNSMLQGEGYLLTRSKSCEGWIGPEYSCEELPFNLDMTGRFLYRVTYKASPSGPGGGKLQ